MEPSQPGWRGTAAYLGAWLASSALVIVGFVVMRDLVMDIASWAAFRRATYLRQQGLLVGDSRFGWTLDAVNLGAMLFLACAGMASVVYLEYYYRTGLERGLLARRVARALAIELAAIAGGLLLQRVF